MDDLFVPFNVILTNVHNPDSLAIQSRRIRVFVDGVEDTCYNGITSECEAQAPAPQTENVLRKV